ncbi:MAG: hypothetical protein KatS3mg110_3847 [Pirellulaceae bacterium]|nr:MAG: hypothetical protein KatS3mg110_3847 [Pirellulaceae bacterium]
MKEARELLRRRRQQRERPQTDTKILAAWNGMAIRAFVDAAVYLEEPRWLEEARKTADFACTRLVAADGSLRRSYTQDEARLPGFLDDYAFLIDGLLALADASGEQKWLDFAKQLQAKQDTLFWDERNGGYFFVSDEHAQLLGRTKIWFDNVTPSGNAMAASNLLRLSRVTGDGAYKKRAEKLLAAGSYWLDQAPAAVPALAAAAAACYLHDEP